MRLRIKRKLLSAKLFVEFFFLELLFVIIGFLEEASGEDLEQGLPVKLAIFEVLEGEVFGVFVGEAFDGDHASRLDSGMLFGVDFVGLVHGILILFAVGFILQTFVAMNSYDLTKS
jgi:hypothetical protein